MKPPLHRILPCVRHEKNSTSDCISSWAILDDYFFPRPYGLQELKERALRSEISVYSRVPRAITLSSAVLSMVLGGLIYLLWRPKSLVMFSWVAALQLDGVVNDTRIWASEYVGMLPAWMCFSLPQALWLMSGCLALQLIWWKTPCSGGKRFWMFALLALAVAGEVGQALYLVEGVFDYLDLTFILLAFLLSRLFDYCCVDYRSKGRLAV